MASHCDLGIISGKMCLYNSIYKRVSFTYRLHDVHTVATFFSISYLLILKTKTISVQLSFHSMAKCAQPYIAVEIEETFYVFH